MLYQLRGLAADGRIAVSGAYDALPVEREFEAILGFGGDATLILDVAELETFLPEGSESVEVRVLEYDPQLEHVAVQVEAFPQQMDLLYYAPVPEPCASLAGASGLVALGLLISRRRAHLPIRSGCRTPSSAS